MGRAYSMDLRERVVAAVAQEGLSRRQAAARFGVSDSTAINWLKRVSTTGSVAPGQIGGHKPEDRRRASRLAGRDYLKFRVRGRVDHHAVTNLPSNMMANWVLASHHSRGGIFHSATTSRKTR